MNLLKNSKFLKCFLFLIFLTFIYIVFLNIHSLLPDRIQLLNQINVDSIQISKTLVNVGNREQPIDREYTNNSTYQASDYYLEISRKRINSLFKILRQKEFKYGHIFNDFDQISFNALLNGDEQQQQQHDSSYKSEQLKYLIIQNKSEIEVNDQFIDYLHNLTHHQVFIQSQLKKKQGGQLKKFESGPTIVTASHSGYFKSLDATVKYIHEIFPDFQLIIYDMGLYESQLKKLMLNCKCEVRKFDFKKYAQMSPHVRKLKTYAFKPLIVQEVLNDHEFVLWIDSSIAFVSKNISQPVDTAKRVGMMIQHLGGFMLTDYTNPLMFQWFNEAPASYLNVSTLEANIIMFKKSFLTSLVMKTWVTCALDVNCIAPKGSRLAGCPGCHRYDQDALTIATTFFYGYPKVKGYSYRPPICFIGSDRDFFSIRRRQWLWQPYFEKSTRNVIIEIMLFLSMAFIFLQIFKYMKKKSPTPPLLIENDYSSDMLKNLCPKVEESIQNGCLYINENFIEKLF